MHHPQPSERSVSLSGWFSANAPSGALARLAHRCGRRALECWLCSPVRPSVGYIVERSGRVIDCRTGEKVARDDADYYADSDTLEADGIGPLEGQRIRVAGIHGGGLSHVTKDGWLIELHPLSWPEEEFFLCPPGQTMLWNRPDQQPALSKICPFPTSLVAYGFSPTGQSLVIATSSEVAIHSRA